MLISFLIIFNAFFVDRTSLAALPEYISFGEMLAVQQSAFDVSARVNKAVDTISKIFAEKTFKAAAVMPPAETREQSPRSSPVSSNENQTAITAGAGSLLASFQNQYFITGAAHKEITGSFHDPGGGAFSSDLPIVSYFLLMLLFFSSSRKEFNNLFFNINKKAPAFTV